eukprot:tig00020675_g12622.t1
MASAPEVPALASFVQLSSAPSSAPTSPRASPPPAAAAAPPSEHIESFRIESFRGWDDLVQDEPPPSPTRRKGSASSSGRPQSARDGRASHTPPSPERRPLSAASRGSARQPAPVSLVRVQTPVNVEPGPSRSRPASAGPVGARAPSAASSAASHRPGLYSVLTELTVPHLPAEPRSRSTSPGPPNRSPSLPGQRIPPPPMNTPPPSLAEPAQPPPAPAPAAPEPTPPPPPPPQPAPPQPPPSSPPQPPPPHPPQPPSARSHDSPPRQQPSTSPPRSLEAPPPEAAEDQGLLSVRARGLASASSAGGAGRPAGPGPGLGPGPGPRRRGRRTVKPARTKDVWGANADMRYLRLGPTGPPGDPPPNVLRPFPPSEGRPPAADLRRIVIACNLTPAPPHGPHGLLPAPGPDRGAWARAAPFTPTWEWGPQAPQPERRWKGASPRPPASSPRPGLLPSQRTPSTPFAALVAASRARSPRSPPSSDPLSPQPFLPEPDRTPTPTVRGLFPSSSSGGARTPSGSRPASATAALLADVPRSRPGSASVHEVAAAAAERAYSAAAAEEAAARDAAALAASRAAGLQMALSQELSGRPRMSQSSLQAQLMTGRARGARPAPSTSSSRRRMEGSFVAPWAHDTPPP